MKLILVLCAVVAVVAASYGANTAAQDPNANLPHPGYNRVYDDFDIPTRGRRRHPHRRRHHHHSDSDSDSDSSDSDSDSHSHSHSRSREHFDRGFIILPDYVPAQRAPSYGGASQDAPARTNYGAPVQDAGTGY